MLVPAYTFVATVGAVVRAGATPVFVDILPETFCMDPDDAEAKIGAATAAMIPVHLFGHPADVGRLEPLARSHGLTLIEDAAQALGASVDGRAVGTFGDAATLSFYPTKNLGGFGDGGMVLSADAALIDRIRVLANHGQKERYLPETIGMNSRLDEFQAAALRVELPHLDGWNARRRAIAERYRAGLEGTPVRVPVEAEGARHVFHLYTVRVAARDAVRDALTQDGIGTAIHYPLPLTRTEAFCSFSNDDTPAADAVAAEALCLPMFPELSDDEVDRVIESVRRATS